MAEAVKIEKKIEIPTRIEYIKQTSREILGHLERMKIDESIKFDIRLAVEEAVRNAMEHGNRDNPDLKVIIAYRIDAKKIEVEVEDSGPGFDVSKVPDPRNDANLMKKGGRGVFLIHKLMDRVEYNKKGNKIKITKSLR